jgi:hypothetical protein
MININDYVKQRISRYYTKLELYKLESFEFDTDTVHPEVTIPSPITVFVSDWNISKIVLPDTLKALDIWFDDMFDFEFNMPPKIEEIVFINANVKNKTIMELFPNNVRYTYSNCCLNGTPFSTCIYNLYTKYFPDKPINKSNDVIRSTNHNYRSFYHSPFINEIKEYEERIAQGRVFRLAIKEELVAAVWHPDKVEKLINVYGIDIIDTL